MMSQRLGVKHWIFQRISNAILVIFGVVLAVTLASDISYESLQTTLSNGLVKAYLAITLLFAFANSILAAWQIAGDYAKKINVNPNVIVGFAAIVSAAYLVIGMGIIF